MFPIFIYILVNSCLLKESSCDVEISKRFGQTKTSWARNALWHPKKRLARNTISSDSVMSHLIRLRGGSSELIEVEDEPMELMNTVIRQCEIASRALHCEKVQVVDVLGLFGGGLDFAGFEVELVGFIRLV